MVAVPVVSEGYHASRLTADPRRDVVWDALWRFHFSKLIGRDACVLDIGCGYGNFINHVVARRRIAVDSGPTSHASWSWGRSVGRDVTELALPTR